MFLSWCVHRQKGQNPSHKLPLCVSCLALQCLQGLGDRARPQKSVLPPLNRIGSNSLKGPEHRASVCRHVSGARRVVSLHGVALPHVGLHIHFKNIFDPNSAHLRYRNACYRL